MLLWVHGGGLLFGDARQDERLCADTALGYTYFSALSAGTFITPHYGVSNVKLRIQLPLIVPDTDPDTCALQVAGEARAWTPGKAVVFDDSFEHCVWFAKPTAATATAAAAASASAADSKKPSCENAWSHERVVLLIDVFHPLLAAAEIEIVKRCIPCGTDGVAAD